MTASTIMVKSHVSRDLLQNAALFKTDKLVVWEYVSNGLQYVDPGTNPSVFVRLDSKNRRLTVADNGRGMDFQGLQNFFVMHGENIDRKSGHPGRGRFGTGKAAAFGIGDVLRVSSVRRGTKSIVELKRSDLLASASGDPIPVRIIAHEEATSSANGTVIEVEEIHLKSLDQAGIIRYIERHLARWPKNCTVFVNNHECEYSEPLIAEERRFTPTGDYFKELGDVELCIKVGKSPIDEDLRGISIFSNGVWHETTLAGSEGKEMANFLFGEIDVPALDEDKSALPPFDLSRSMRLNSSNELVQRLYAFIGQSVEQVRRSLVERDGLRKATEEAKRLAEEASEIARYINDDFDAFRNKLTRVRAKLAGNVDSRPTETPDVDSPDLLTFGHDVPGEIVSDSGGTGATGEGSGSGDLPRTLNPRVLPGGDEKLARPARETETNSKNKGGFSVEFRTMGVEERRAAYAGEQRTIFINLDHPQVAAARGDGSIDDPTFRRLAYEVAFTEYAIALSSELAKHGEYLDPSDPIFEIRETVNRLARKGAELYSRL